MNIAMLCITRFLMELSSMSALAESFDSSAVTAASFHGVQPVATLSPKGASMGQSPVAGVAEFALSGRIIQTHDLRMGMFRAGVFTDNDRAAFSLCAPTQRMNRALSFMRSVSGVRLNDSLVSWIQGLSAMTKRQLNAEFNYSSRIDKRSELNSSLAYRLHPDNYAGKSEVMATLRYSANF